MPLHRITFIMPQHIHLLRVIVQQPRGCMYSWRGCEEYGSESVWWDKGEASTLSLNSLAAEYEGLWTSCETIIAGVVPGCWFRSWRLLHLRRVGLNTTFFFLSNKLPLLPETRDQGQQSALPPPAGSWATLGANPRRRYPEQSLTRTS